MKFSQKIRSVSSSLLFLTTVFLLVSCGFFGRVSNSIDQAVNILDDAIDTLDSNSKQWQQVLEDTQKELLDAGQSTISNEVSNVLSKSISDIGVEAKCYTDFMRDRVKEDLKRIRAELTGEIINLVPVFCKPTPSSIDFKLVQEGRQNNIELAGYNLDSASIRVSLENGANLVDVTGALATPSRYLATLNLGANGVKLTNESNKIIFRNEEKVISTVNVIQPIAIAEEKVIVIPPLKRLCPKQVGGDREFDGHGPNVQASAQLLIRNQRELFLKIYLNAKETKHDWTEATLNYESPVDLNLSNSAKIISVEPNFSKTSYTDSNHQLDIPSITGGALVNKFEINGDTSGNDINNCTTDDVYMNVYFNRVTVKYLNQEN